MSTAIPYGRRPVDVTDVNAKEDRTASLGGNVRFFLTAIIAIVALYGAVSWFRIDSLVDENTALATQVSALDKKINKLEAEAASTEVLRQQLQATKADLAREIARKNLLTVEVTTLKGRITQGERDLAAALEKLRVYEKQKPKPGKK